MTTTALRFQVVVGSSLEANTAEAISWQMGPPSRTEGVFSYGGVNALSEFYEDLLKGAPFPFSFHAYSLWGADALVAVAIYLHRELALLPQTTALVGYICFHRRMGEFSLAHVPPEVAAFIRLLESVSWERLTDKEQGERISTSVSWIREYLLGDKLPHLVRPTAPSIITVGSNGFVVAESLNPSREVWTELYRAGYLRGVLMGPETDEGSTYLLSKKSEYLEFDLYKGEKLLNELEAIHEGPAVWKIEWPCLVARKSRLPREIVLDVAIRL